MKEIVAKRDLFGLSEEAVGQIVQAVAFGRPLRDVGAEHGLTTAEVRTVIDRMAVNWFDGPNLRRELLLELERLNALARKYFIQALKGDQNSTLLFLRIAERKSLMTGMSAQQGAAHTIINQTAAPERQTTTQEIASIIDEIRGLPKQ
jgi:hypothetical protein